MLKLTVDKMLYDRDFKGAIYKLYNAQGLGWQSAQRIATIYKSGEVAFKAYNDARDPLLNAHCLFIDDKPQTDPQGNLVFKTPEDQESFRAALQPVHDKEIEVNCGKLSFKEIGNLRILSPAELDAITEICEGVPDPDGKTPPKIVLPPGMEQ